jgi:LysM repeat protein
MSVATEFAPLVYIPERARRTGGAVSGVASPTGLATPRRLTVVPERVASAPVAEPSSPATYRVSELGACVAAGPLRLTRRGVVVLAMAVVVIGGLMLLVARLSLSAPQVATPAVPSAVTVQTGDTLWSIAREVAPNRDPRAVVDQLKARNHLAGNALTAGQTLDVG